MTAIIIDLARFRAIRKKFKGEKRVPPSDKRYIKFPTPFNDFICRARLTEQQNKMLHAAIRYCHGFHRPDRSFDLIDLRHWLGWDRRKISLIAKELAQRAIFVTSTGDNSAGKYRINNESQQWNRQWKGGPVDKPVDNPVDNSKMAAQLSLLRESLSPVEVTAVTRGGDKGGDLSTAPPGAPIDDKATPEKENSAKPTVNLLEMSGFLKKSLKKIKESEEESDLRKKKNEIFKKMARARLWTDDELFELAARMSAEELEALYEKRRRAG